MAGCQEFHMFGKLPVELQDYIWRLAVRPDVPHAHFFKVHGPTYMSLFQGSQIINPETTAQSENYPRLLEGLRIDSNIPGYMIAAQYDTQEKDSSWTVSNRSGYIIDAGLWKACKHSSKIMEQRYKTAMWAAVLRDRRTEHSATINGFPRVSFKLWDKWDVDVTDAFHFGEHMQVGTVFARKDLFCIEPLGEGINHTNSIRGWLIPPSIETRRHPFGAMTNIAMVYDEDWPAQLRAKWWNAPKYRAICRFYDFVHMNRPRCNIYLIDYGIHRAPIDPSTPGFKEPQVFLAHNCKFVEVTAKTILFPKTEESSLMFLKNMKSYYLAGRMIQLAEDNYPEIVVLACEK